MKKLSLAILSGLMVATSMGQTIYNPFRAIGDQGISLKFWGSGTIAQTEEVQGDGPFSLRVSTRNYFQGGSIHLANPVDLGPAFNDKANMLSFGLQVASGSTRMGAGGPGGRPGGPGGLAGSGGQGGGGASAGGDNGDIGGPPGGRQGGAGQGGNTASLSDIPLRNVRLIITTSDGKKSEAFVQVSQTRREGTWIPLAVPLASINGFDRTNKQVTSVAFSGDATSTFYINNVKVINDTTPIQGEMNHQDPLNIALGDEVEFIANGFAGATPLKYSWDFDASDGIQEDTEGQVVKRKFRRAGVGGSGSFTYTVTLTISDLHGVKKPVQRTVKVTVNP